MDPTALSEAEMDDNAERMSAAAFVAMQNKPGAKPSKYRNKPTIVDGIRFDSKAEAKRWNDLKLLRSGGLIRGLERQVTYPLEVNGVAIASYRADFAYVESTGNGGWRTVVEDVKGYRTPEFILKAKLMMACYGIEIREIRA